MPTVVRGPGRRVARRGCQRWEGPFGVAQAGLPCNRPLAWVEMPARKSGGVVGANRRKSEKGGVPARSLCFENHGPWPITTLTWKWGVPRIAVPMPATTLVLLFSPSCASHGASFVASLLLHNLELMHVQSSHGPIHTGSTTTSRTTHPRKQSIISLQIIHLHLHLQHTLPCHAVLCACICHSRESPHPPSHSGAANQPPLQDEPSLKLLQPWDPPNACACRVPQPDGPPPASSDPRFLTTNIICPSRPAHDLAIDS